MQMAYDPVKRREQYLKHIDKYKAYNKSKVGSEYWNKLSRDSYHKRKTIPKNIITNLLKYAKARAKQKNLEFSLTREDIIIPEFCPYLKVKLEKGHFKYTPSIDRIDSTKGYTKDNIQIISKQANAMKWDSNPEELIQFAKSVLDKEGLL
jgi:hypothetical protein